MDYYKNSELLETLVAKYESKRGAPLKLGTHNGEFHSDDVLSTALVQHALETRNVLSIVVRTRDPKILDTCDLVYDVGNGLYDHHDIRKVLYPNGIQMASCGKLLKDLVTDNDVLEFLRSRMFYTVEAIDNGQDLPMYRESSMLGFVRQFNPTWESRSDKSKIDKAFFEVLGMVRKIYERVLSNASANISARRYVEENATFRYDGKVMLLPEYCTIRDYARMHDELLAVVYPSDDRFIVKCTSQVGRGFATKVAFPEDWRGAPRSMLPKISGIPGLEFCHPAGHLASFKTPKDAKLACDVLVRRKAELDMQTMQIDEE